MPDDTPCTIATPREETEGQIGIAGITLSTPRQNYVNTCSLFLLIGTAQRERGLKAVILIRNDGRLNNDHESGNFLDGTTYAIFTEKQFLDAIISQFGGEQNIRQMSAKIRVAPDEGKISLQLSNLP